MQVLVQEHRLPLRRPRFAKEGDRRFDETPLQRPGRQLLCPPSCSVLEAAERPRGGNPQLLEHARSDRGRLVVRKLPQLAAGPESFVLKLNGAEVFDERSTLAESGALDGSIFLLAHRRRRPVR